MLALTTPESNSHSKQPIQNTLRFTLPAWRVVIFFRFGRVYIRLEIHLVRLDEFCPLIQLPSEEHDEHDGQFNVQTNKVDGMESVLERGPPLDENEEAVENNREPGSPGVRPILEREQVGFALGGETGAEANGSDADGDPAELVGHADDAERC